MNPIVYLLRSFSSLCSLQPGFCYRKFLIKYKWYRWREKENAERRNIIASWQKTMEGILNLSFLAKNDNNLSLCRLCFSIFLKLCFN
jgi:hypothetical protein